MNKKYAQEVLVNEDGSIEIPYDWYESTLPANLVADENVYFDTSYSFRSFHSHEKIGIKLGFASGNYGRSNISAGKNGIIEIGKFVILAATNIICNNSIKIGDHCMFSWGSVITDFWIGRGLLSLTKRRQLLEKASHETNRYIDYKTDDEIVIEDNVWVGFDAVILPGVHLGKGCIIGCKTIIDFDVPAYAVVAGNPAKIVRYLQPTDTDFMKEEAMKEYIKK